jgi:uncharacterized protein YhfF
MERRRRIQFWGRDADDDHLVREIVAGLETASVCKLDEYHRADGPFDDGGWEVGDLTEVYDLRGELRCTIEITEVYPVRFGDVPEGLWRGENCTSAESSRAAHRRCWPDYDLTDDFEMMATHFRLVDVLDGAREGGAR